MDFLVMEKSWKINVEKEGAPCLLPAAIRHMAPRKTSTDPWRSETLDRLLF